MGITGYSSICRRAAFGDQFLGEAGNPEQIEGLLLKAGRSGSHHEADRAHREMVQRDGAQVCQESVEAVNGLALGSPLGASFLYCLWRSLRGSHHGGAQGFAGRGVCIVE